LKIKEEIKSSDIKNKLLNQKFKKEIEEEKRKNLEINEEIHKQGLLIKELNF